MKDRSRLLPMFPLGTVALPWTVMPLHIFEERYRALMRDLTDGTLDPPEFGIVLIERGSEVGGGDQRSGIGTVVRLVNHRQFDDGRWLVLATGTGRVRIENWLPDAPYPRAEVEDWPDEPWSADPSLLEEVGRQVPRRPGAGRGAGRGERRRGVRGGRRPGGGGLAVVCGRPAGTL